MHIGFLLVGLLCIAYFFLVAVVGGVKKSPAILKLVKMKLGKNMSDEKAVRICIIFGTVIGAVGVFLLVFGAIQGAA